MFPRQMKQMVARKTRRSCSVSERETTMTTRWPWRCFLVDRSLRTKHGCARARCSSLLAPVRQRIVTMADAENFAAAEQSEYAWQQMKTLRVHAIGKLPNPRWYGI